MPDPTHPTAPTTQRHTLPNGLTLLLEPDPHAQTTAAGYFVNTGSREETPTEMGASHFIEHLLFKGSDTLSAAQLNERLDDLGGNANAFTSEEATVYHAATLPEHTPELLTTLTELMRPALRDTDIHTERSVILEEIAMYAEQPTVRVTDELRADYWGTHPLGWPILGTTDTVTALTPDALRRNHRARYGAQRVTLTLTGQFDPTHALHWATTHLSDWPAATPHTHTPAHPHHPRTTRTIHDPTLTRVQVTAATPGLSATHPLREAAHILADLIGGENGALYWHLIDNGTCDTADLGHLEYHDTGTFEGGFSCDPDRAATALTTYRHVLADADTLITPAAVRRAARKLAVSTLLRAETPQGRLFTLGMEHLATGHTLTTEEHVRRYEQVTADDVREVLRLSPLNELTIVALGPITSI